MQRPDEEDWLQPWEQQMHHASVWILSWHCNSERISWSGEREDDQKFNYCQWDTTDQAILTSFTAPYKEYKDTLIDVIDDLTRHSYIAKLKVTSCWYRAKSEVTTRVKNTASYIPWLYTTWGQMVAFNMIHCVLVLMKITITQAFCIKFNKCLFIILMLITHI